MKIYTNTFDLSRPSPHRFWVSPYSDFKFGIKLVNAGAEVQNDFTVAAGTTELTPDEDKIDGFTIFTAKSADTGFVEYTIDVADIVQKFKLVQIVTDSTVFEVGGGGDVPADVATQTWVNSQISDFITDDELTAYATKDELTGYVENGDLTAYYTKSETSSATEIADAIAGAGGGSALSSFAMSEKPVACSALIREALDNSICLPETIYEDTNGEFHVLDISGDVDFCEGRIGSNANILSAAVRVNIGTNISAMHGRTFGWTSKLTSLVIPEGVVGAANGNMCQEMFTSSKLDTISATVRFPDSWVSFGGGSPFWNSSHMTFDFGDTRKTIPTIGGITSLGNGGDVILVPDALYDKWITTSPWNDTSTSASKVHPRSSRNAAQKVGKAKTGQAPIVNTIHSVYETDWAALSATADANTFYVVIPDPE